MNLSIVLPAYNEEKRIGKTLDAYLTYFTKKYHSSYELIVVMNGCKDNTAKEVEKYHSYKQLKSLNFKEAIGKGGAIIEGFKISQGDYIGFVDADNSTSPEEFEKLFLHIGHLDGIIASRYIPGSIVEPKQALKRRVASRVFNLLIRLLFNLQIYDSQCGAKLFTKKTIKNITPHLGITRWAFDVDLLYQMKRRNLSFKEYPTVWKDAQGSALNIKKATFEMFLAITRLRLIYSPFKFVVKIYDKLL